MYMYVKGILHNDTRKTLHQIFGQINHPSDLVVFVPLASRLQMVFFLPTVMAVVYKDILHSGVLKLSLFLVVCSTIYLQIFCLRSDGIQLVYVIHCVHHNKPF